MIDLISKKKDTNILEAKEENLLNWNEIIAKLKEESIDIESDSVILRKQIRSIGDHEVEINPYPDIIANIIIKVRSSTKKKLLYPR